MAPPNDPKPKASEREAAPDSGDLTPHPRFDENIEGDPFEVMRKYQVVTMPPNARLKMMQMKLPEAPPELLQDTVPPNGGVLAPPARGRHEKATTEAPVVDRSRYANTVLVTRVQRKQRLRTIVVATVGGGLALLLLGLLLTKGGREPGEVNVDEQTPAATPRLEDHPAAPAPSAQPASPQVLEKPAAAAPSPAAPPPSGSYETKLSTTTATAHGKPAAARPKPAISRQPTSQPAAETRPTVPAPKASGAAPKNGSAFDAPMRPPSE
jgi:hypothetical protein